MKNSIKIFAIAVTILLSHSVMAQLMKGDKSTVSFYSKTPLEDIDAKNTSIVSVMNTATKDIQIQVVAKGFVFKSALMQEHFNENYMESEKFPISTFKGKINEAVDFAKDGVTKVTASGKLIMHGVSKEITISGTVTVKGEAVTVDAKFPVKLEDYEIKVPSLYVKNIAEVIDVTMSSTLLPFKK
jgi:polyisoprenoid-binding protein YceI